MDSEEESFIEVVAKNQVFKTSINFHLDPWIRHFHSWKKVETEQWSRITLKTIINIWVLKS